MQLKIRSSADFWAGLMFIGFGLAAIYISRNYSMGTAMRMGPGYFPTYLGAIMLFLGAVISLRALKVEGESIGSWAFRPLLMLGGSILAFGLMMETAGFIPALIVLLIGSAFAGREFKLLEVLLLSVVLIAASVGIFVYGIELPFRLFWWS